MRDDDAARVHDLLRARSATVATAESLTGGRLAARLTAVPGASATYVGGVVTYATALKESLLGVPHALVEEHGVVSGQCAAAMAVGVRSLTGATYALSTTGVAGPAEQDGLPPGTVFVAVAGPDGVSVRGLSLAGDRSAVVDATCGEILEALRGVVTASEDNLDVP